MAIFYQRRNSLDQHRRDRLTGGLKELILKGAHGISNGSALLFRELPLAKVTQLHR
jgi:hypothetical protein